MFFCANDLIYKRYNPVHYKAERPGSQLCSRKSWHAQHFAEVSRTCELRQLVRKQKSDVSSMSDCSQYPEWNINGAFF
jgi:hypothetical protein